MATTVRLKQLAQQIIKALPAKHPLLALAAGLPPVLRSAALTRVWAYLAATLPQTMPLRTNLGFSRRHYRFTSDQARAVFGKPELYAGNAARSNWPKRWPGIVRVLSILARTSVFRFLRARISG
ncbi:MAG: hypothetical protein IPK17_07775 [Chloroflexi bacterium]|uniref:hypothetical protein n=1 Tax=Candidatus Flexifilum breve TaxID=3140694 RepID=UPI003135443E|nr:hypothetical protein [Chloroflexota bacterium]